MLTYRPQVFDITSIEQARAIILTPEGMPTNERWERETPYLCDLIDQHVQLTAQSVVLDYGCGIGRMSKALIDRHGCSAVGVDISMMMRVFGPAYVQSDRFCAMAPTAFDTLHTQIAGNGGMSEMGWVDLALAVWIFQHCLKVEEDVKRVVEAIRPGGHLFLVNNNTRAVPTVEHAWVDDGVDIKEVLAEVGMQEVVVGKLDTAHVAPALAAFTFWGVYRKK